MVNWKSGTNFEGHRVSRRLFAQSFEIGCWLGTGGAEQALSPRCSQIRQRAAPQVMNIRARDPGCGGSVEGGSLTRSGVRKGIVCDLMSGLVLQGVCQVERGETAAQTWRVAIAEVQPEEAGVCLGGGFINRSVVDKDRWHLSSVGRVQKALFRAT